MSGSPRAAHPRAADAELAGDLVRGAGELAHRMRADGVEVETKSSISDLVTAADHAAEEYILTRLARERPDDGVLGEEGAARPSASGRRWVIDPVDGTYNFVAGLPWWCSALALVEGGPDEEEILLGAVHHPYADLLYLGGPGLPTTRNGLPLAPLRDRPLAESCLATYLHPPYWGNAAGAVFGEMVTGAATLRMLGSGSMDLAAIAEGTLQVSCQHTVPEWDRLPGVALVLGLGGAHRRVQAGGVEWSVTGVPTAVAEVCDRLLSGAGAGDPARGR
ncbi:inositol monophosphatase family protein [Nocardioides insulae]|uniref:inositol monophosphatase family protein n=1 Tax=Nocardioides insulae TaxID=394734 RepID=UPI00041D33B8|nr:inositol monophosphatase family protein [Nocardioides insulae]